MHRRRASAVAAFLLALALAPAPGVGAAPSTDPTCGTPLGVEAELGANLVLSPGQDPEFDLVDTLRMPGAQRSPETIVSAWGRLVLVAEAKVDKDTNFTWGVFARIHSNLTGWNAAQVWLSSANTSQYYPQGVHIRPSAALWNDRLWVAWDAQGSELGGPNDRMILLRSTDAGGAVDASRRASETDPNRTTQHPNLIATSGGLELAYSTSDGDSGPSDSHIVVRSFDGSQFGPSTPISNLSDGWADALPTLAYDGASRLFAGWTATNATGVSSRLMFAWREAGVWSPPVALAELGHSPSSAPALAAYNGRAYVAFTTDYMLDVNGVDSDVRWRVFDPGSLNWSAAQTVNPEPSNGDDAAPTLTVVGPQLYAGWTTTEDFYYSHGSDSDAVYRTFDGSALGPLVELSDPDDNASDASPHFVRVGAHLYAHWMVTPTPIPGAPRGDAREGVRLVDRPTQWYDGLHASFRFSAVSENGSAHLLVDPSGGASNLPSPVRLVARLPNGEVYPLAPTPGGFAAWVPVDPTQPDFEILACGKPIALAHVPLEAPAPPPGVPPGYVVALGVAAVAGIAFAALRRRRGPPKEGPIGP